MPHVNRAIELLARGQPVYYTGVSELSYAAGRRLATTWADFLMVEFEHRPLDLPGLEELLRGLGDAGPTPSGHRTPPVICTLPVNGSSAEEVRANAWQIRHLLAVGVHGLLLCHARTPEAVRAFVACCRYPHHRQAVGAGLAEGLRGRGSEARPAAVWGLSTAEYFVRAEPWPLNPDGELLLGLKIEDRHALANTAASVAVPGIGFAEWGPGDMGLSYGRPDQHDPPYGPEMESAWRRVKAACDAAGVAFLCSWNDPALTVEAQARQLIDVVGARIISSGPNVEALAAVGRRLTGRDHAA
ncbi:MAG: hypothetical protein FJ029_00950 [Actinobacteria bacterium]|nr:hypothetical protein [Actinomycetota bacterium]